MSIGGFAPGSDSQTLKHKNRIYFASESVGEGHPDKVCDQISDAILDACLKIDPNARCAMETATKTGMVVLLGEISVDKSLIDFEGIVRKTLREIGFTSEERGIDCDTCQIIINVQG
jgi:S-adenosylmethionine synthetase